MKPFALFAILLVAIISFDSPSSAHALAISAAIPTEGGTWTNPTITIVITPLSTMPWFKASYAYDVSHAIDRWVRSIIAYTDAYGSYYLRKLNFTTCISGVNESSCGNPDIRVQFIQSFGSQSAGLGLTSVRIQSSGIFVAPTTTTLAVYDPTNTTQLTDTDMINIASHEFGHALGLNHATVSRTDDGTFELMFLSYGQAVGNSANSLEAPSTLDLYALAQVYRWLKSSSMLSGPWDQMMFYALPAGVAYSSVYPYAEQIQALQNSINRKNLEITVLAIVAAFLLAIVLVLGILLSRKKPVPPQPFFATPPPAPPEVQTFHLR